MSRGTAEIADVSVIGGGPVGLAAAYYAGHRDGRVRIIEALGQLGGQVAAVYPEKHISDVFGHPRIGGQEFVDRCSQQALQYSPEVLLGEEVCDLEEDADDAGRLLVLRTRSGRRLLTRSIIVTAGHGAFEPRRLEIEDVDAWLGRGLHYFVREKRTFAGKKCVIVGGGDSALDWTLGLQDTAQLPISLVHRRSRFRAHESSLRLARELEEQGTVAIAAPAEVREIHGNGVIQAITLEDKQTGQRRQVECDALITLLGFHSHLGSIADWPLTFHSKREILVDAATMRTSLAGVYAAGDIAGYPDRISLITIGFAEAAIAANNAMAEIRGEKAQPDYSTE